MLREIIEAFRQGLLEGERELAVAEFGEALLSAVGDAALTDSEVDDLCALYDRLGITIDEWAGLRDEVWEVARNVAAADGFTEPELRELRGIRAFLGGPLYRDET